MKYCGKCQLDKEEKDFGKDVHRTDGLTSYCKNCRNAQAREYGKTHGTYRTRNDNHKEYRKEYYSRKDVWRRTKNQQLISTYGITIEEYEVIAERQNNACAICSKLQTSKRNKVLAVDHCHKTGKIRGLLCEKCNRALGLLDDNPLILKSAVNYLERFKF